MLTPEEGQLHEARIFEAQAQHHGEDGGQDQVAYGPSGADRKLSPTVIAKVEGIDRHRLGPAEEDAGMAHQEQERQDDGPHGVDVGDAG